MQDDTRKARWGALVIVLAAVLVVLTIIARKGRFGEEEELTVFSQELLREVIQTDLHEGDADTAETTKAPASILSQSLASAGAQNGSATQPLFSGNDSTRSANPDQFGSVATAPNSTASMPPSSSSESTSGKILNASVAQNGAKPPTKSFNHSNGASEDWKLAQVNAKWSEYPITEEMFNQTYTPGNWSNCGFRGLRDRLDRGENITIGVYGDSVTWGTSCISKVWGQNTQCSWPNRIQKWIKTQYPTWNVVVKNFARRSYGPRNFLDASFDVDVADAYIAGFLMAPDLDYSNLMEALKGPKIILSLARTCSTDISDCRKHCVLGKNGTEAENVVSVPLDDNRQRLPAAEGTPAGSLRWPSYACKVWWEASERAHSVAARFGISVADYKPVYWPDPDHPTRDLPFFFNGMSHPDTVGHDFLSHLVEYALWREFNTEGPSCAITKTAIPICPTTPLSFMDPRGDSSRGKSLKPTVANGWRLFEDVPTKPGWIAETFTNTSQLTFQVTMNKYLVIMYLATYNNIAPAILEVQGCPPIVIDPLWSDRVSMPKARRFTSSPNITSDPAQEQEYLSCLPTQKTQLNVTLRATTGKFKLLFLSTC